jgi:hypothetical protein
MKQLIVALVLLTLVSCKPEQNGSTAQLTVQFEFDETQERLNNLGQPAPMPAGHAGQTPDFSRLAVHYIELSQNMFTGLGQGEVLYKGTELTMNGQNAIDYDQVWSAPRDSVFAKFSVKDIAPGTYEWVRVSVAAQYFDFNFNINNVPIIGDLPQQKASIASIIGFNSYLTSLTPYSKILQVNDTKKQGFWALETRLSAPYSSYSQLYSGQAPEGATTVVNPLFATSPVPQGSCVITGQLAQPLVITGNETEDISMVLSFSVNQSLEWIDTDGNNQLDLDATTGALEQIVDMGLRGVKPKVQ